MKVLSLGIEQTITFKPYASLEKDTILFFRSGSANFASIWIGLA